MLFQGFERVPQVVGAAYTYQPSLAMRKHLTKEIDRHHSSQHDTFTFFYKGTGSSLVGEGGKLRLRTDPRNGEPVPHWPEAELVMVLGERHEILGYSLANDFTAYQIEVTGRDGVWDGTFFGKCWQGSGSLGPRFLPAAEMPDLEDLAIGLKIERDGKVIYDQTYSTKRRRREFHEIPDLAITYFNSFKGEPPPSKNIRVGDDGFLLPGTALMLGTGLIVKKNAYSQAGDIVTVYCEPLGRLSNEVV